MKGAGILLELVKIHFSFSSAESRIFEGENFIKKNYLGKNTRKFYSFTAHGVLW